MNTLEKYKDIFVHVLGVHEEQLDEKFTFQNIQAWDSVAHLSLISELEDCFDVMFDSSDILHFGSYLNGINILKKYGVEF